MIGALFGVIGGLIVIMLAMIGAFAAWVVRRFDQMDARFERLEAKFDARFERLETKIESLTIAVSRLEGAVYHGLPEPRRAIQE